MSACTFKRSASMERRSKWRQAKAALTFAGAGLKATGRTLKVAPGDRTPGGKVVAIDKSGIVLQSGGSQTRLTMPD